MPLLSVVSVVKDDSAGLGRTLRSLDADPRVELVVVDGSADRLAIQTELDRHPRLSALYAWREPLGVYPAMNEGLALASGEYLLFLNAGDTLVHPRALDAPLSALEQARPVWAFAQVRFVQDGKVLPEPSWTYADERARCFARGRFPAHQGTFTSRAELQRQGGFDTSYRIVADYASMLRSSLRADPLVLSEEVAQFDVGGLSWTHWREALGEFHQARIRELRPTGRAALIERLDTARNWAATWTYRTLRRAST